MKFQERPLAVGAGKLDPWGKPKPYLKLGQIMRFPGGKVWVVTHVNESGATVFPLTPTTRMIRVPHRLNHKLKVEKEVNETGESTIISVHTFLPSVAIEDLDELEFSRLTRYVEQGVVSLEWLDTGV